MTESDVELAQMAAALPPPILPSVDELAARARTRRRNRRGLRAMAGLLLVGVIGLTGWLAMRGDDDPGGAVDVAGSDDQPPTPGAPVEASPTATDPVEDPAVADPAPSVIRPGVRYEPLSGSALTLDGTVILEGESDLATTAGLDEFASQLSEETAPFDADETIERGDWYVTTGRFRGCPDGFAFMCGSGDGHFVAARVLSPRDFWATVEWVASPVDEPRATEIYRDNPLAGDGMPSVLEFQRQPVAPTEVEDLNPIAVGVSAFGAYRSVSADQDQPGPLRLAWLTTQLVRRPDQPEVLYVAVQICGLETIQEGTPNITDVSALSVLGGGRAGATRAPFDDVGCLADGLDLRELGWKTVAVAADDAVPTLQASLGSSAVDPEAACAPRAGIGRLAADEPLAAVAALALSDATVCLYQLGEELAMWSQYFVDDTGGAVFFGDACSRPNRGTVPSSSVIELDDGRAVRVGTVSANSIAVQSRSDPTAQLWAVAPIDERTALFAIPGSSTGSPIEVMTEQGFATDPRPHTSRSLPRLSTRHGRTRACEGDSPR